MKKKQKFKIDLGEIFEKLPKAPIVEAVIHWRAQPSQKLIPKTFLNQLRERLPDYPVVQPQHELEINHQMGPSGATLSQSHAWQAFQFASVDQINVAQFGRNGLVVSRLAPYEHWELFREEALRLWQVYSDLAAPPEVQRLGVRYINLIPIDSIAQAGKLLAKLPAFPGTFELTLDQFTNQTKFEVPNKEYALNLIQTIQPAPPNAEHRLNLIVDIDVFTSSATVPNDESERNRMLAEMRWIKNKSFFGLFTKSAIEQFRE